MNDRPVLFIFLACAFFLSLGSGCASLGGGGPKAGHTAREILAATPEMERNFREAERLFYARKFNEAEGSYRSYLSRFSFNALSSKACFRLGEIFFHEKDLQKAVSWYKKSLARGLDADWGTLAVYKMAVGYSRMVDARKVFLTLDRLSAATPGQIDPKIGVRAGSLRVSTARKAEDLLQEKRGYLELIDAYEGIRPDATQVGDLNWIISEKTAREEIGRWMLDENGKEDPETLKKWIKGREGRSSAAALTWKVALLYSQRGDYKNALGWGHQYILNFPKHDYIAAARALIEEIDKRGAVATSANEVKMEGRPVVGVLLPLSGKYKVYGESVLHGLECAAGIFSPCRGDLGLNLVVRDTAGNPKQSARIVEEFSKNESVRAVVGPLPQVEVDEAVVVAEKAGLPMVALSQKPDLAKAGDFIFRNFLTVADQVATIVDYACHQKHWRKFAVLYPQGNVGQEYRDDFAKAVARCGGKLIAQSSYPEGSSMTDAVRSLKFSSSEGKPDQSMPFEALFIPDVYRRVHKVVQVLDTMGLPSLHLLGGAGWDHPGLVSGGQAASRGTALADAREGGQHLEGAVFVDGFFVQASNFQTRDFVSTFHSAYEVDPTLLEAYAYDTLRLIGEVLRDHPTVNRLEFQKLLSKKKNFSGVTGNISFDDQGDARRRLFVLTVDHGEIREVR